MEFISPKVDYAFKKIFGSEQSKDILISFLNAIIYGGKKIIQSLTIINPYNPGQAMTLKDRYLDIKAVLYDGYIVVIEMQIARVSAFSKRVVYNLSKAYTNQLGIGEDYLSLTPVIAVTLTDFILFKQTPDVINQSIYLSGKNEKICLSRYRIATHFYRIAEIQENPVRIKEFKR